MAKARINVTLSEELKEWCDKQSEAFGMSNSALMVIALSQYKQQMEGLNALKDLGILYEKLEEISKKMEVEKKC